jgi:hypothetical protein
MRHYEDIVIMLVISVPAYFFWRWLYLKFINDNRKRQIAAWCSTILITPFIYRGAIYLFLFWMCYYPTVDFEKRDWAAHPDKRYEMFANIIESHMLIGKTKDQVKAILGNSENYSESNKWYYYLGCTPGFAIDPDLLYIEFNNGKVVNVTKVQG